MQSGAQVETGMFEDARAQLGNDLERKNFYRRLILTLTGVAFVLVNTASNCFAPQGDAPDCIEDSGHDLTGELNDYFGNHETARHILEIVASFCMDMTFIMLIVLFLAKLYTMRPLIALIILFFVRALIQRMFQMRQPDGHYWDYPGFPSLTVPYVADRNDFFYSGHVGTAVVVALQYRQEKFYKISYVIGFVAVFEGFILIVLRAHYTVDIVVGAFFGHLFCTFATFLAPFIDPYIFKPTDDSPSRHNPSLIGMTSYHTKEIPQNQVQGQDQAKIREYRDKKK